MGKSDEYIEYEAYTRYLIKVTFTPYEPDKIEDSVFRDAMDKSELRTVYDIIVRIIIVMTVVIIVCAGILIFRYMSSDEEQEYNHDVWTESRLEDKTGKHFKLYEAYKNSNTIRDCLLWEN